MSHDDEEDFEYPYLGPTDEDLDVYDEDEDDDAFDRITKLNEG